MCVCVCLGDVWSCKAGVGAKRRVAGPIPRAVVWSRPLYTCVGVVCVCVCVWQRCLQHLPARDRSFIILAVQAQCLTVARHRHGCCVLQRCLDAGTEEQREALTAEIVDHALVLMQVGVGVPVPPCQGPCAHPPPPCLPSIHLPAGAWQLFL